MRYFFDEVSRFRISDLRGRDFGHDEAAIAHARRLASDARSLETVAQRGKFTICVVSEHGNEIHEETVFGP